MRRGQGSSPFSLFSFQDIITCVSGIIILITLMLVLELLQRRQSSPQVRTQAIASQLRKGIEAAQTEVAKLKATLADDSSHLEQLAGVSVDLIRRDVVDTESEVTLLESELSELESQERSVKKEDERLQAELFDRSKDEETRKALEESTHELESQFERITNSDQLIFNPITPDGKAVWIVQIESGRVLIGRAGKRQRPEVFESGILRSAATPFVDWLASRSTSDDYFFLLIRPSGAAQFVGIRDSLVENNFAVGFDLLDENTVQSIRNLERRFNEKETLRHWRKPRPVAGYNLQYFWRCLIRGDASRRDASNDGKNRRDGSGGSRYGSGAVGIGASASDGEAELESQRRAMDVLLEQRSLVDPIADELWTQLAELQKKRDSLDAARLTTLGRTAKLQASINKAATSLAEIESREQELRKRNAELNLAIDKAKKSMTRDAELPRIRASNKIEVQTSLRYGRFYVWHKYDSDGFRSGLNTDDYVVLEEAPSSLTTTQLPYAGTPIDDSEESVSAFTARLKRFGPSRYYIQVSVWPDSFGQFSRVKELLVENGLEYRLIPAEEGSKFMDRGGTSEGIQ